jgi:hypothetical protein
MRPFSFPEGFHEHHDAADNPTTTGPLSNFSATYPVASLELANAPAPAPMVAGMQSRRNTQLFPQ